MNKPVKQEKAVSKQETAKREYTKENRIPAIDVAENDKNFLVYADMPGVNETSVKVQVENETLRIEGESLTSGISDNTRYMEWKPAKYIREFTIGHDIDRDNIKASVSNGVLKLLLPKAKNAMPKGIKVIAG